MIKKFEEFKEDDVLVIFDLDETLVLNPRFEDLAISHLKESVTIKSLLTSSVKKIKVSLNDLKWENGRIYVPDPNNEIEVNSNWIRKGKRVYLIVPDKFYFSDISLPVDTTDLYNFYQSVKNKAIVTGRPNIMRNKIIESLGKFKLDIPNHGLYCYPTRKQPVIGMISPTSDNVSVWKSKVIIDLIRKSGFKKVEFYDDNSKWVNYITRQVLKHLPNIEWKGIKYKHGVLNIS